MASSNWSIGCGSIFVIGLIVREKSTTTRLGVLSWKICSTIRAGAAYDETAFGVASGKVTLSSDGCED
ncbi:hypothetical protein TNCV_4729211 [Trichonephila clavipes]|nr:hypothetical protein TNCV_4729211 [Trichonephila clavipes]